VRRVSDNSVFLSVGLLLMVCVLLSSTQEKTAHITTPAQASLGWTPLSGTSITSMQLT